VNRPEGRGIHTLYISRLKALAIDIARNLEAPVNEMGLAVANGGYRRADRSRQPG
jgi:Lhr-like helicase